MTTDRWCVCEQTAAGKHHELRVLLIEEPYRYSFTPKSSVAHIFLPF